jgi:Kef-type K+ transport system membrane component KefB
MPAHAGIQLKQLFTGCRVKPGMTIVETALNIFDFEIGSNNRGSLMQADVIPLIVGLIILLASLISLWLGLSVAIIEITLGAIAGNLGMRTEEWMLYLATFGGILLTFLAGTEIDMRLMKEKFKVSFLIGSFSFFMPFIGVFLFAYYLSGWSINSALIAGIALSTTSLAVVYAVLVETGLNRTELGKVLMASTFITDMGTALALSIVFLEPTWYTALFVLVAVLVIVLAVNFSHRVFENPKLKNKVIEPEIKYIFLLLLIFIYFANLGEGHAVLPAFLLGLLMSSHFSETSQTKELRNRLRTVAYAVITPLFFIVGGLRISLPLIYSAFGLFVILFFLKMVTKFAGVYFFAKRYLPHGEVYTTLLMSTGLTFGTISSVFGLNAGYIDQVQYSVLVGVVVASAVIPTFIAQKWFMPVHSEDILDINNDSGQ